MSSKPMFPPGWLGREIDEALREVETWPEGLRRPADRDKEQDDEGQH